MQINYFKEVVLRTVESRHLKKETTYSNMRFSDLYKLHCNGQELNYGYIGTSCFLPIIESLSLLGDTVGQYPRSYNMSQRYSRITQDKILKFQVLGVPGPMYVSRGYWSMKLASPPL